MYRREHPAVHRFAQLEARKTAGERWRHTDLVFYDAAANGARCGQRAAAFRKVVAAAGTRSHWVAVVLTWLDTKRGHNLW